VRRGVALLSPGKLCVLGGSSPCIPVAAAPPVVVPHVAHAPFPPRAERGPVVSTGSQDAIIDIDPDEEEALLELEAEVVSRVKPSHVPAITEPPRAAVPFSPPRPLSQAQTAFYVDDSDDDAAVVAPLQRSTSVAPPALDLFGRNAVTSAAPDAGQSGAPPVLHGHPSVTAVSLAPSSPVKPSATLNSAVSNASNGAGASRPVTVSRFFGGPSASPPAPAPAPSPMVAPSSVTHLTAVPIVHQRKPLSLGLRQGKEHTAKPPSQTPACFEVLSDSDDDDVLNSLFAEGGPVAVKDPAVAASSKLLKPFAFLQAVVGRPVMEEEHGITFVCEVRQLS
jgi:hypothetical protein